MERYPHSDNTSAVNDTRNLQIVLQMKETTEFSFVFSRPEMRENDCDCVSGN